MKKVKWTWDWGVYVPLCPYCNELVYDKEKCVFCGKKYEWVEGKHQPTVIEHNGYTIVQCTNNHIQVYKDGHIVYHASCTKKMTEDELKEQVAFLESLRKESK
jgi:hypothetical protein